MAAAATVGVDEVVVVVDDAALDGVDLTVAVVEPVAIDVGVESEADTVADDVLVLLEPPHAANSPSKITNAIKNEIRLIWSEAPFPV